MFLKYQNFFIKLCLLLFCLTNILATPIQFEKLLPHVVEQDYEIISKDNKYYVSVKLPNGSNREELVEFEQLNSSADITDAVQTVKGNIKTVYDDKATVAKIMYEIQKDGSYIYTVRYYQKPPVSMAFPTLSASALKIAVG